MAGLSPQQKRRLQQRAANQARLSTADERAQARAGISSIRRSTQQQSRQIRSSTDWASGKIGNISLGGLHGRYKQQVGRELALRAADLDRAAPFLIHQVQTDARGQIADLRAGMPNVQALTAQNYAELAQAKRQSIRENRQAASQDAQKARSDRQAGIQAGITEAKRLLAAFPGQAPSTKKEWARFTGEVGKAEGVDGPTATRAVAILRAKQALRAQKKLPPTILGPSVADASPEFQRHYLHQLVQHYLRGG